MGAAPLTAADPAPGRLPLHVEELPGRPPATVWLHHGLGSTRSWTSLVPALRQGRRAVLYDRRGFGASPRDRAFTPDLFVEDAVELEALVLARGLAPAHLVGHSDGGTVALLLAARRPDLVRSVAVVATHVCGEPGTVGTLQRMGRPSRDWDPATRRGLARAHGADWERVADAWHALWTSPAWAGWSIEAELPRVRCPLLVCHDRRDDLAPPLHAERLQAAHPEARVVWWETGSHEPHRRHQAAFAADLARLWAAAEDGADPRGAPGG